ncbi:Protein of unknown function [Nocardioides scoriae]|uniref:DUF2993 domain-containing protein n=1 Tax=Nocardioides scoriae TaxID=642780 RepID=A0A1H1T472_9ACTN|nr:DUF2993 domain-containing protein [Nocardioides scoriae]SDS55015.1 Protein of unknown function [Nocardioides scoriae]
MRALLWTLVVLVLLAVGLDRGADWYAERTVATRLAASQGLEQTPEVDIAGFPFLTQVAARRFDRVTATVDDLTLGSGRQRLGLADLRLTLRDVTTDRSFSRVQAARGRAVGTVSYAELGRLTGLEVTYVGEGRVRGTREVTVAGRTVRPALTVTPRLLDGTLGFADALADGSLPDAVAAPLREAFGVDVPLEGLPFGVRPTSLRATESGLRLTLVGRDLTYSG